MVFILILLVNGCMLLIKPLKLMWNIEVSCMWASLS